MNRTRTAKLEYSQTGMRVDIHIQPAVQYANTFSS